ncbi:MAG TPA: GDP-mannose 4,6-dehydratase [Allosphingosinicella sp.]|jgi:GDPmannose 4,6-dehydratase
MSGAAPVALVTGVEGQDGRYMADLLRAEGWRVIGTTRSADPKRSAALREGGIELVEWDLLDQDRLVDLLRGGRPSQIYNFAAYSTGSGMYDDPIGIAQVNGLAVTRILEAIRAVDPAIRFCQASSSEMFGQPLESPQREETPFNPRSPYGAAKLYGHNLIGIYRGRFGLFACSAILFNHESPYRTVDFVTRKVSRAAAAIKLGLATDLALGNLDARRDWGFAGDTVRAMRLMLRADEADDYVVATGSTHSVRDLCEAAFAHVGLDYRDYVRVSAADFRPVEARQLVGDPAKAKRCLGWEPTVGFAELVEMMVEADLGRLRRDADISGA